MLRLCERRGILPEQWRGMLESDQLDLLAYEHIRSERIRVYVDKFNDVMDDGDQIDVAGYVMLFLSQL